MSTERKHTLPIIRNSILESYPDCDYYKLPDAHLAQKPYDARFFYKGNFVAIEAKILKYGERFFFSSLQRHQKEGLLKVVANYGEGYVFINLYKPRQKGSSGEDLFVIIEINDFLFWEDQCKTRSLSWEDLKSKNGHALSVLKVKNGKINLSKSITLV